MAMVGLYINNTLAPAADKRYVLIEQNSGKKVTPSTAFNLPEVTQNINGKNVLQYFVRVEGGSEKLANGEVLLKDLCITQFDTGTNEPIMSIRAARGIYIDNNNWQIQDYIGIGRNGTRISGKRPFSMNMRVSPQVIDMFHENPETLTFMELYHEVRTLKKENMGNDPVTLDKEVAMWNKLTMPLSTFFICFIGAALGFRPQRSASRGMAMGMGVVVIFSYYSLYQFLVFMAGSGKVEPELAAMLPLAACGVLSAILVAKTTT
jgi:lipopolysaccharide export LptBFGC system permease protein LptF